MDPGAAARKIYASRRRRLVTVIGTKAQLLFLASVPIKWGALAPNRGGTAKVTRNLSSPGCDFMYLGLERCEESGCNGR